MPGDPTLDASHPDPGRLLSVVGEDEMPRVNHDGSILQLARRFGELAPRLDLFELNDELYYYDHRRERQRMTSRVFRSWIEQHVTVFGKYDSKSEEALHESISAGDAADVLVAPPFRRGVRRILAEEKVRLPVIREGSLALLPWGYDATAQVYTVPGGFEYELDWPLDHAFEVLEDEFGKFPFETQESWAVFLAAMLTLFVRHLPGGGRLRPGILALANRPGVGKSMLAKSWLFPVTGTARAAKLKSGEEFDKEVEAFQRSGQAYYFLDNVKRSLNSATLDQLLTSEESSGRAMGGHGVYHAGAPPFLCVTANESSGGAMFELDADAARRFLVMQLFSPDDPADRSFDVVLNDQRMREESWRKRILSCLWALVKNWDDRGRVDGKVRRPTFEDFSRLVGGILEAAEVGNPFSQKPGTAVQDVEEVQFVALLEAIVADMGAMQERFYSNADLVVLARAAGLFETLLGTKDDALRRICRDEGLKGPEATCVEDDGRFPGGAAARSASTKWGAKLRARRGMRFNVGGYTLAFGKRGAEKVGGERGQTVVIESGGE